MVHFHGPCLLANALPLQVPSKDLLHWGLNVRMAIATGTAENVKVSPGASSVVQQQHDDL